MKVQGLRIVVNYDIILSIICIGGINGKGKYAQENKIYI